MKRKSFAPKNIPVLCVLFLFLLFSGCSSKSNAPGTITILVPPSISSIPFFYLADTNHVTGTDIIVKTCTEHAQALALLLRGDADYIYTGTTQGWESYWGGNPLVAVSSYVWGVSSLCIADPEIRSLHDLKGKSIAIPFKNSPLDIQTRIILVKTGLLPDKDVKIVYSAFTASMALLQQGKIAAAAFPEPIVTNLIKNKGLHRLFEYIEAWKGVTGREGLSPQATLYTTARTADKLHGFTGMLQSEVEKVISAISANPVRFAEKYSTRFKLPVDIVAEAIRHTYFRALSPNRHKMAMLGYYDIIKAYLPDKSDGFKESFFFN